MGDVATHEIIENKCRPIANEYLAATDTMCMEVGNWLTDFSQFRDPTSFISGKYMIWDMKRHGLGAIPLVLDKLVDADSYLDDLMGKPGQDGALGTWARNVALAVTLEHFCDQPKTDADKLDVGEVQEIFDKYFTQYYPHEHLDFPPWPWGDLVGDRTDSSVTAHSCLDTNPSSATRKLYQYTDDQLVYLSDRLTHIHSQIKDWLDNSSEGSDHKPLRKLLCEFGHANHALQDFYFHSNFVEQTWQKFRTGPAGDSVRSKRRYYRRLKGPIATGMDLDIKLSKSPTSTFTGYFGSTDMYHTFADAAAGFHEQAGPTLAVYLSVLKAVKDADEAGASVGADLPPEIKKLADLLENPNLDDEDWRNDVLKNYRVLYRDGVWDLLLAADVAKGKLQQKTADAVKASMKVDDDLAKKYTGPGINDVGVMGFILTVASLAKAEHDKSDKRAKELDDANTIDDSGDIASSNGASGENIGSHSLMAKDSVRKEPLRPQAVNIASLAAKYLTRVMFKTLFPDKQPEVCGTRQTPDSSSDACNSVDNPDRLDWLHLLQHFVCHPNECETQPWNNTAIDDENAAHYHKLHTIEQSEIDKRCKEEQKDALEKKYKDGEDYWQKQFAGRVLSDSLHDKNLLLEAAVVGAVAGAIAGAIIGGMVGGPMGAVAGALIGAVGGALVGVVVAAIGAAAGIF